MLNYGTTLGSMAPIIVFTHIYVLFPIIFGSHVLVNMVSWGNILFCAQNDGA